ncbi:uncharacterized protein LOC126633400 isoform X1 [Malus sylvestris]|uniref:uncharacterized protein LOC126633400 isoform X1 n=1 Tax=Malus sylvestris TaxID=3752 RepID=UPI0021ABD51D|nr:uncharacterized protein LOC126633400 isoform X1 [Malus sylvestris]
MASSVSCRPSIVARPIPNDGFLSSSGALNRAGAVVLYGTSTRALRRVCGVRASAVDSYEGSSNFANRMEKAWLISKQPRPIACSSCNSNGHIECKWCAGTGFFILGDNMLCQVSSKSTSCVICTGKVSKIFTEPVGDSCYRLQFPICICIFCYK